jgi:L-seryl-tRNA(Ser) seleniumtransferase
LGTAACVTAGNDADILSIPTDMNSLKNEVIVQKSHRYDYDHAVRNCGVRFVEVETLEQYEQAFNERTVMTHFFNAGEEHISREDWVRVAHKHGVPCFNDAAADVPPISNLWNYTQMGFDLVTFSGGKGLRGPQCTGLLLGRKDLIEAARKNNSPNSNTVGRGMKVAKEEIVGLVAAVDWFSGPGRRRHGSRLPPAGGAHCRSAEEHPDGTDSDIHSCGGEPCSPSGRHL